MRDFIINAIFIVGFLLAIAAVAYGTAPVRRGPEGF